MPRPEPEALSPDEQVHALAAILAVGVRRWARHRSDRDQKDKPPSAESVENRLDLSPRSWLTVHLG